MKADSIFYGGIGVFLAATVVFAVWAISFHDLRTPPIATTPTNNAAIPVDKLFTHEGCTVYRFRDAGYSHYYAKCAGGTASTDTAYSETCGKGCSKTVVDRIQTEIRNGS